MIVSSGFISLVRISTMSPAYPTVFISCNNLGIKVNRARNRSSAADGIPGWDSLAVYCVMALA